MPRYEFSEGTSNKFWDITLAGTSLTTHFGKIGANGQKQLKELGSAAEAQKEYDRLVAEKTKKGYTLVGGGAPAKKSSAAKPAAKPKAEPAGGMYFEFSEGSSSKFWEIGIAGTTVTTRYGKIGTDGSSTPKTYKTAGEAKSEHDKLVAEKTKKGYKLVRGAAPAAPETIHARDAKLEAAIESAPDDVDGYEVYADWLQGQGDPRGELIALHVGKKDAAANKLLAQHASHFYGKLAEFTDMLEPAFEDHLGATTTWRWGYLEKLWISQKFERSSMHDGKQPALDVAEALDSMLGHPSARFLRELAVGIESYEDNSYDHIAKVIGKHRLPTLRKVVLGDFFYEETELNWSNMGTIEPMYKAMPNLESLTLRSGTMKVGKIEPLAATLVELVIISGGLDKASFNAIMSQKWPRIEHLHLELGDETKFKIGDLQALFDGKAFPKIKRLGLGNSMLGDAVCQALAASKIAGQIEALDMSKGSMGDAGATALAGGKLGKLAVIDVDKCFLSPAGVKTLAKVAKKVDNGKNQEDGDADPDDRYISGNE